jgi:hypothetical protein
MDYVNKLDIDMAKVDAFIASTDITAALRVVHLDDTLPKYGGNIGYMPNWVPKTEEIRLQSLESDYFTRFPGQYYVTEKLDGMSCTVIIDLLAEKKNQVLICSRNYKKLTLDMIQDEKYKDIFGWDFWNKNFEDTLPRYFTILEKKYKLPQIVLQGELIGPGYNDNYYRLKEPQFYLYQFYLPKQMCYEKEEIFRLYCQIYGLPFAPLVYSFQTEGKNYEDILAGLKEFAQRKSVINPNIAREGIVARQTDVRREFRANGSFKVMNDNLL